MGSEGQREGQREGRTEGQREGQRVSYKALSSAAHTKPASSIISTATTSTANYHLAH